MDAMALPLCIRGWRIAIKYGGKISGTAEPFWAVCNIRNSVDALLPL